jgi:formate C-acetyltransferase
MGHANAKVDSLAGFILSTFANALDGKENCLGGCYRAGTGTAMYHIWHARDLGATADGRLAGESFGTNFSPSLFAKVKGPVSDIESFSANDLTRNINGGPLTLELASSVFASEDSISKVAMLIKYFIERGGHQLQLNAVNPEAMRAAQENPDAYRQLVVRIWGWSAYFVELDREFQDHVLARQEYSV